MSISFSCPDCGKSYQVRDDLAGRRFKCKDCERPLKVPSAVKSEEFFDEEPARRPARRKQSTGRKSSADRKRSSSRSGRKNGPQSPIQTLLSDKKLVIITACVLGLFAVPMCSCCGFFVWVETKVKQQAEQQMAVRMAPVQRNNSTISYDEQKARLKTNLTTRGPAPQEYEEDIPLPEGVEEVAYESAGRNLKAWIDRRGAKGDRSPALVYFHGGFAFGIEDLEACAPFREQGYIVLAPTVRGENGNPGTFELFLGEVDDAAAACRWLAAQEGVDTDRIYAFGHSVGGGISSLLSLQPDVPIATTGSSGGLYCDEILFEWGDIAPFTVSDANERGVRMLLGNLQYMRRPHIAYIGHSDIPFELSISHARDEMRPDTKLKIERVRGDHFISFDPALRSFLDHTESLAPVTAN